jgi:hypothetical protein
MARIRVYHQLQICLGSRSKSKNRDKLIYFIGRVRGQLRRVGVVIGVEMEACEVLELRVN